MDLAQFHFLRPYWLALLPVLLLLVLALKRAQGGAGTWKDYCDPHLLPFLTTENSTASKGLLRLLAATWLLAVLALAGPTWSKLPKPVYSQPQALVVILDLSLSMFSEDTRPNRVARAKFKLLDILHEPKERETGLIVFAGDAFVVSPLTDDAKTIAAMVPSLSPDIMPEQGGRVDLALDRALDLLDGTKAAHGEILLIADGVADLDKALQAAGVLRAKNHRLSVLGVGDSHGAPVRLPDGKLLKDGNENIVSVPLDRFSLRRLARAGGGRYADISVAKGDLDTMLADEDGGPANAVRKTSLSTDIWEERGPLLLILLLPLAAIGFRKGWLGVFVVLALTPPQGHALDWQDLWFTPNQRGARAFADGDMPSASKHFKAPAWRGAAQYRAGDFAAAAESFAQVDTTRGQYNLGNALVKTGDLEQALAAYERALEKDPSFTDAENNRKLIEDLLKQRRGKQEPPSNGEDESARQPENGRPGESGENDGNSPSARDHRNPGANPSTKQAHGDDGEINPKSNKRAEAQNEETDIKSPDQSSRERRTSEKNAENGHDPGRAASPEDGADEQDREKTEALAQWLRRIPDDPGGLLRRKFLYQHRMRANQGGEVQKW